MRYQNYISTNIPWISEMPDNWKCYRGKRIFSVKKEKNDGNKEGNLLSLTLRGVVHNDKENPIGLSPADYATYQIFERDDLVFKLIDLENISTSRVGIVPERGIMSSAYIRLSSREDVNVRYFYLQYYSWWLRNIFNGLGAGVRQTLSADDLINLRILVPPRDEQDQIVRYLDWQVSKINKLIQGYQKQIKLANEREAKLINDALTIGLNSKANLKYTKAEWMGMVPEHWKEMRVKNFFIESTARSIDGSEPHLSMSQKYGLVTDDADIERRLLSESYIGGKLVDKNDLVLNRLKAHLGVFALAPIHGIVSPDYTVLKLNRTRILPDYAEQILKCNSCRGELVTRVRGIVEGFWRLYTEDLGSIYICLPSLEEQEEIINYINNIKAKTGLVTSKTQSEIDLLREYRTRLISDVVTGQIDVRGIEIPEYTPIEDMETDMNTGSYEEVEADAD